MVDENVLLDIKDGIRLSNNPQKIQNELRELYDKKTKAYKLKLNSKLEQTGNSSRLFDSTPEIDKIQNIALYFHFSADRYWNKGGGRNGFKSAWCYANAGRAYEEIRNFGEAGKLYHFAAHQFRTMDSMRKAMDFYFKSSIIIRTNLAESSDYMEIADRSIFRAIGIAKNIGDEQYLHDQMVRYGLYSEITDQFNKQNPWD